jgi:hypothetical protein
MCTETNITLLTNQVETGIGFSALNNKIAPSAPFVVASVESILSDDVGRRVRTAKEESSIAQVIASQINKTLISIIHP